MPEGDTVWRQSRSLHDALVGKLLISADLRVPAHSTESLAGLVVPQVRSQGKHILIELQRPHEPQPTVVLHTTLGMDGSWRVFAPEQRWNGGPGFAIRTILKTASVSCVGYRLPHVDLLRVQDLNRVVGHLGPDLIGDGWDAGQARGNLLKMPQRGIGDALLDQRNLAGIGNVYKSELCFIAKINPATPVERVENLDELLAHARRLLELNKATWRRTTTSDPRRPLWVYKRAGQPCRSCGSRIRSDEQGLITRERLTWWCPECQPR